VNDDVSLLTKRTATGIDEIVLIEGTFMNAGNTGGFDAAIQSANYKLLKEDDFILFIDIRRARFSGIRPLPLRIQTLNGWEIIEQPAVDRNNNIPEEIDKCFLLRGKAPMRPYQSGKWDYVEESVMKEMLGFSLQPFLRAL
jgi:hypothetical protein